MGTRFYLANTAAGYTPASVRGTWSDVALTGASKLSPAKSGAGASAARAETSTSGTWSVLLRRFVSDPINNAATLDGAATLCFGLLESSTSADMVVQLHAYVTAGDTGTVRGTLTALAVAGSTELPGPPFFGFGGAAGQQASLTLNTVNAQPGDRVVVEVGYRALNTVATSYTGTVYYGGTGTDLVDGNTAVTTRPGWIEFAGAGFATAFGPQYRTGQSSTPLGLTQASPTGKRIATGRSSTALTLATSQPLAARKTSSTTALTIGLTSVNVLRTSSGQSSTALDIGQRGWGDHLSLGPNRSTTALTLEQTSYASLEAGLERSAPDLDLLPHPELAVAAPPVTFIAQDIRTRQILDQDLPLVDPVITFTLSGATLIRGNLRPEYPALAELGIDAWASWIHVDEGGELAASGILMPAAITDGSHDVTAIGFSGYAAGLPFLGDESLTLADPADIIRKIWDHIQSYPDGQLAVTVDQATKTPVTLGVPAHQDRDENGQPAYDETTEAAPTADDGTTPTPDDTVVSSETDPDTLIQTITYADGSKLVRKPRVVDAAPYQIGWWTDTDCGQEIDNLAKTGGIEYLEQVAWTADRSDATRHLLMGYPRLGRKRPDLRCAQDENLLEAIPLEETPEQYASQVLTRGMGEGRAAIRGYAGGPDPRRVRRVAVVTDQTIQSQAQADATSRDERVRRLADLTIGQLDLVADHSNMPRGSYLCGDEVLVVADVDFVGRVELWHRIQSYDWMPDANRVQVSTRRADQFAYGRYPTPAVLPAPNVIPDDSDTSGGSGGTPTASSPGELLRIGAANKQNHYKIQLGEAGKGSVTEKSQADIGGGYTSDGFKLSPDKTKVIFRVPMNAPTTSGSKNPRSELREIEQDGVTEASWIPVAGIYQQATIGWTELPPTKKSLCGAQIHDEDSDVLQILTRLVGGKVKLMYRLNGKDDDSYVLIDSYTTGREVEVKLLLESATSVGIYIDGSKAKSVTIKPKGKCYFKAGAYPQSASDEPDSAYAAVSVRRLVQWRPGWPTPIVESGGTGTTGSGGSSGVTTSVFGSCCNASDSGAFSVMAGLKPRYWLLTGDWWYDDGGSDWEKHMRAIMGATNCKKLLAALPDDGLHYTPSDHDYAFAPNGLSTSARTSGFGAAYRKLLPHITPAASTGVQHSWVDGPTRYIVLDERSFKTSSTILGTVQSSWFHGLLQSPGAGVKLIVVVGDTPFIGPATSGDDGWKGYDSERSTVAGWVSACKVPCIRIDGDMHCLRITANRYGFKRIYGAAPYRNETKVKAKGAEIDWSYPTNDTEGPVMEQFGALLISNTSGKVTVTCKMYSGGSVQKTDTLAV